MRRKQLMYRKPAYFDGQLLLAEDFIAEQKHHAQALRRHSAMLHGFGVVRGLEVGRTDDGSLRVDPGFAVDGRGREIELRQTEVLPLQGQGGAVPLAVTLGLRTESADPDGEPARTLECFAVLEVSGGIAEGDVLLAMVRPDAQGRLGPEGIDTTARQRYRTPVAPGSIDAQALDDHLRRGWIKSPFRPIALPQDQADARPPFRVGPTETAAHLEIDQKPNTRGAAGTMAILLPPQARRIHRLRVAGAVNEKTIRLELFKGGWDPDTRKHVVVSLLKREIPAGAYDETLSIPDVETDAKARELFDCSTLSLELHAEGYARVSLIAVEVSY